MSDKPKFEHLFIDMHLRVSAEFNPELGMKDDLHIRRGMACPPPTPVDFDDLVSMLYLELRSGLRALKHSLQMHGYIDSTELQRHLEMYRQEYLDRIKEELESEGYDVTRKEVT